VPETAVAEAADPDGPAAVCARDVVVG
jgi:hypothetical protein